MNVFELVMKEGRRRNLSPRTLQTYCQCIRQFFNKCKKEPNTITKKDIKDYLTDIADKNKAGNTLNVHLSALKFFFEEILCRRLLLYMKYSKTPKELPTVLTQNEVQRLFAAIQNKKHSLMIRLMYSAGLRVSELVNLKLQDLEFEKHYGWVRNGKGRKDRLFLIAEKIQEELQAYIAKEQLQTENWLFEGRNGHMHQMSVHQIVKKAAKKANIKKNVHSHTLRHSYATHLIENGYDISSVQSLLGHTSAQTTMRYIHMASPKLTNVKSPYDSLVET